MSGTDNSPITGALASDEKQCLTGISPQPGSRLMPESSPGISHSIGGIVFTGKSGYHALEPAW